MNLAFKLFRLQQVDTQIDQGRSRLSEIESALSHDEVLRAAQATASEAKAVAEAARKAVNVAESEANTQREKLKQNQDSLYGGKVRSPKELQDLQLEAESLGKHVKELEDTQLERMMAQETALAEAEQAEKDLEGTAAQRAVAKQNLLTEQEQLTAEQSQLAEEREAAFSGVPADALATYEGLRKSKNGLAVVKVNNQTCGGCGAELSAARAQAARVQDELTRCDSCKRILYAG